MRMLRLPDVKLATGHRSHASIYTAIRKGLFTKPVLIGQRAVGWPDTEVRAIVNARIAGSSEKLIHDLVADLHKSRSLLFCVEAKQPTSNTGVE